MCQLVRYKGDQHPYAEVAEPLNTSQLPCIAFRKLVLQDQQSVREIATFMQPGIVTKNLVRGGLLSCQGT